MDVDLNNIISNNIPTSYENNKITDSPSHEVSLTEHQIQPEFNMTSQDNQLSSQEAKIEDIPLGQDNLLGNASNLVDYSNSNAQKPNEIPLFGGENQIFSNFNSENNNISGGNINGEITGVGNDANFDFLKATSEQYNTEELLKANSPKIFTSKILDDTQKIISPDLNLNNPTNNLGGIENSNFSNAAYPIGKTEELSSFPLTGNLYTTNADLSFPQNQISQTGTKVETNITNQEFSSTSPINMPIEKLGNEIIPQNIDSSVNQTANIPKNPKIKEIDLSDPKIQQLIKENPKVSELLKKYRSEVVVESREEVKYIPVKKIKYVKKLKIYIPTIKKVYVPGKKVVVPIKKKVYVPRPKNVMASQLASQISTQSNPIASKSTYSIPLSPRINNLTTSNINTMTQSVNVNNPQVLASSINPSMSLNPYQSYSISTNNIGVPLVSSTSNSNLLQSPRDLQTSTMVKSFVLDNSYIPNRVISHSLPKKKLNNYYY
jgi:hypothetical protein